MPDNTIDGVVRPLLTHLAWARSKCKDDHVADTDELFAQIEGDVQCIKDIFYGLETWERDVKDEFGVITRHLDGIVEKISMKYEFQSHLRTIVQLISSLKQRVMAPPQLTSDKSSSSQPSGPLSSSFSTDVNEIPKIEFHGDEAISMSNLREKYEQLSMRSIMCLLSFLVFPISSVIKKTLLIYWWIGERTNTVLKSRRELMSCLEELIQKGFVYPIYKPHKPQDVDSCMVHPKIHLALVGLALEDGYVNERAFPTPFDPISARPCASLLEKGFPEELMRRDFNKYNLGFRTCFNVNHRYLKLEKEKFMEMRNATVMFLGRWQNNAKHHIEIENTDEFFEWLESFKKLRYLSLRGISRIMKLPPSIGALTELKILDLRACHNLETLPVEVKMLKQLTHLDASECYLLDHMPRELGSLSKLEVLKGFVLGSSLGQAQCQLGDLSKLEKLRKLHIYVGHDSVVAEGEFNEISKMPALRLLTITWGVDVPPLGDIMSTPTSSSTPLTAFMSKVSPPQNLEKLDIRCFPLRSAPEWWNPSGLKNLRELYIRGGNLNLRTFGREEQGANKLMSAMVMWPSVKVLRLRYMNELDLEESDIKAAFPNLDHLEVLWCKKLSSATPTALEVPPPA